MRRCEYLQTRCVRPHRDARFPGRILIRNQPDQFVLGANRGKPVGLFLLGAPDGGWYTVVIPSRGGGQGCWAVFDGFPECSSRQTARPGRRSVTLRFDGPPLTGPVVLFIHPAAVLCPLLVTEHSKKHTLDGSTGKLVEESEVTRKSTTKMKVKLTDSINSRQ